MLDISRDFYPLIILEQGNNPTTTVGRFTIPARSSVKNCKLWTAHNHRWDVHHDIHGTVERNPKWEKRRNIMRYHDIMTDPNPWHHLGLKWPKSSEIQVVNLQNCGLTMIPEIPLPRQHMTWISALPDTIFRVGWCWLIEICLGMITAIPMKSNILALIWDGGYTANSSSPSDRKDSRISGKAHSCARNSVKNEKGRVMVREYFRDIALEW